MALDSWQNPLKKLAFHFCSPFALVLPHQWTIRALRFMQTMNQTNRKLNQNHKNVVKPWHWVQGKTSDTSRHEHLISHLVSKIDWYPKIYIIELCLESIIATKAVETSMLEIASHLLKQNEPQKIMSYHQWLELKHWVIYSWLQSSMVEAVNAGYIHNSEVSRLSAGPVQVPHYTWHDSSVWQLLSWATLHAVFEVLPCPPPPRKNIKHMNNIWLWYR